MTSREVICRDARRASQIRPFLYVGGISCLNPRILDQFTTTINLIPGFRMSAPPQMRVIHIPVGDEENVDLSPYWTTVFKAIDSDRQSSGKVLLLCGMGISRSATFAIAYLMCIEKMSLLDAYKQVQKCRNIVCPNVGFFRQMIELEEKVCGKSTVRIIEPVCGVPVADVVWNELYDEMLMARNTEERMMLKDAANSNERTREENEAIESVDGGEGKEENGDTQLPDGESDDQSRRRDSDNCDTEKPRTTKLI